MPVKKTRSFPSQKAYWVRLISTLLAHSYTPAYAQGGHRAMKVLEKNAHFSRAWKVLENGIGP